MDVNAILYDRKKDIRTSEELLVGSEPPTKWPVDMLDSGIDRGALGVA